MTSTIYCKKCKKFINVNVKSRIHVAPRHFWRVKLIARETKRRRHLSMFIILYIVLYYISITSQNFNAIISNKKFRNLEHLYNKKGTTKKSLIVIHFYSNFT